jgi:hypothetical protein
MPEPGRTLVISDGDVPALVGLAHAVESRFEGRSAAGAGGVVVMPVQAAGGVDPRQVLRSQAVTLPCEVLDGLTASEPIPDLLLSAGRFGATLGVRRVVWPLHAGAGGDIEAVDIALASRIIESALLAERLLALEEPRAPLIETPFADLSDGQVAELAVDMGLIPGAVWWTRRRSDLEVRAAERWGAAFAAAGVSIAPAGPEPSSRPARLGR